MMKRKLDAARIEEARRTTIKSDTKEAERREIQETISKNRRGERKVKVILPDKKPYAYQESKRIRVAAYCRVSTAEEAQMNSFEMQVQHFEQVISENPMYEKADIYKDEGISGTSIEKRKDFQRMIEDCKAGKIDLILTKSISRFGRNIVDILSTLKLLDELTPPVAVTFESEGISTAEGKNKLIISILSALAELESQQKSIAIKQGINALWAAVRELQQMVKPPAEDEAWPEFVQPTHAGTAYQVGDKVTFRGERYICVLAHCVWSPADYPAGWEKQA